MLPAFFSMILTLAILCGCANSQEKKNMAYGHFQMGVSLLGQGKYESGLEQLLLAHEMDPDNHLIANHLGLAYYFLGEYELAIVMLKKSIALKNDYSEAHNNIGRSYIEVKDYPKARHHLAIAARDLTYPNKDKVWFNMGLSFYSEGEYNKSENYFLKAINFNRNNCLAYNFLGRAMIEQEKYEKAKTVLDQAIYHCRSQGYDEPHYYSAIAYFRLGQKSQAQARLQESLKLFPKGLNRKKVEEMIRLMKETGIQ